MSMTPASAPSRAARLALAAEVAGLRAEIDGCLKVAERMVAARAAGLSRDACELAYERARSEGEARRASDGRTGGKGGGS